MTEPSRIEHCFARLLQEGRAAFISFIMAGDPDLETSQQLLNGLPEAGCDIIELGMAFSDPMADGPAIQAAGLRALKAGQTLRKTLEMVRNFRAQNSTTPLILMGYYNPIYHYGVDVFLGDAKEAGVDGLIIVDLPPECDDELCVPALEQGIHFIRLATPTTDETRLPRVLENASGFLYYVSIAGVTGTAAPDLGKVATSLEAIRSKTELPIAVGFGVKTREQAHALAQIADGVVVGSSLINTLYQTLNDDGQATKDTVAEVLAKAKELAAGVRGG